MATSTNPRDERQRNRDLRREEEERREQLRLEALQEQRRLEEERRTDMERADVVRKRLQKSVLKDQGVLLSDTEDRVDESPPLPAESHFVYEKEEYNLTLSPSASEESDNGDIISQSGKSEQFNARTTYLEEEKIKIGERMQQVNLKEQETLRRGRELEERHIAFERKMAEKEDKLRQAMKKKMKNEMYAESLMVLKQLEKELLMQQNATLEKERSIEIKEKELELAEKEWKARELAAENQLREKIQRELRQNTVRDEIDRKQSSFIPQVKVETEMRQKFEETVDNIASHPYRKETLQKNTKGIKKEEKIGQKIVPRTEQNYSSEQRVSLTARQKGEVPKVTNVSTFTSQSKQEEPDGQIGKVYVGPFSGTQPTPKHENTYEVWRLEVKSLMSRGCYSDIAIVQAIWKSLRGQARNVLFTLGSSAKAVDILERLESVYGNVASGEAVLQEFYTVHQEEEESVADWGLRLEQILQRAIEKGHVTEERKDQMLRDKFWRSLYNQDLKNATKIYHQSVVSFDKLQRKVRAEEYEMQDSIARHQQPVRKEKRNKAQHNPQLTEMDDQLEFLRKINEKISNMDRGIQQLKRGQNNRGYRPRRRGDRGRHNRGRGNSQTYSEDYEESNEGSSDRKESRKDDGILEGKKQLEVTKRMIERKGS